MQANRTEAVTPRPLLRLVSDSEHQPRMSAEDATSIAWTRISDAFADALTLPDLPHTERQRILRCHQHTIAKLEREW